MIVPRRLLLFVWVGVVMAVLATAALPAERVRAATDEAAYKRPIDLDCVECHEAQASLLAEASEPEGDKAESGRPLPVENGHASIGEAVDEAEVSSVDEYAAMHVQKLGFTCTSCHEDTEGLAAGRKRLNSGKQATRLRKSSVEDEACLSCHDEDALTEATEKDGRLTDKKGTAVNPHSLLAVDDHEDILCVDCHRAHETGSTVEQAASAACSGCHHAGVFECGTCH